MVEVTTTGSVGTSPIDALTTEPAFELFIFMEIEINILTLRMEN